MLLEIFNQARFLPATPRLEASSILAVHLFSVSFQRVSGLISEWFSGLVDSPRMKVLATAGPCAHINSARRLKTLEVSSRILLNICAAQ